MAEIETNTLNEGKVVQVYKRFRIDGDITDGPFTMNETVQKQGVNSITGVVYGFHTDENYKYLDVRVTGGTWAITDTILGSANSTTAQISAIEDRVHVIDVKGGFVNDVPFKGYTSGESAFPTGYLKTQAAITDNTGGSLTVDTASLEEHLKLTLLSILQVLEDTLMLLNSAGLDIKVGDQIASSGHTRFGISIISGYNTFTKGNRLYKVVNAVADPSQYCIITEVDLDNNFIYVSVAQGTFGNGDIVGDYGAVIGEIPNGYASISTTVTTCRSSVC